MKNYSIWNEFKTDRNVKSLNGNRDVDVLIIGGGITGLSTLYQLKDSGLSTVLVERNLCGGGVSSKSTVKITFLQEKIYMNIRNLLGEKTANIYLKSQIEATKMLKSIIEKEKIDCDLEGVDSYLFTNEEKNIAKLEKEYNFLKSNGVKVEKVYEVPFPESVKLALKVCDTFVFHPVKYMKSLKKKLENDIFENTKVDSITREDSTYICSGKNFNIRAKYVVIATRYPYFLFPTLLPLKSHIETSYLGATKVENKLLLSAINIDDECHSLRYYNDGVNNYMIYLLNSYIQCNIKDICDNFDKLKEKYDMEYVWSNNDIITNDYLPYIGRIKKNDNTFLIATGYNTWGMTNGTLSGCILSDIIKGQKNKYEELFDPSRAINLSKIVRFPIDLGCNIKSYITNKNTFNNRVTYKKINGKNVAIYEDAEGKEHKVLNKCPHMKCGLIFNEVEKTWDCMCHGSRFDVDGKCIEGPSNYDISIK